MFYYLFYELIYGRFKDQDWYLVKALNVFQYVTFRTAYASITAMLISLVFGRKVIDGLKKWNIGQQIREEGPQAHIAKRETPTMGGLLIIASVIISTLLWARLSGLYIWLTILATLGFGAIGFADDYVKLVKRRSLGLTGRQKLLFQLIVAVAIWLALFISTRYFSTKYSWNVSIPFFKSTADPNGISVIGPYLYLVLVIVVLLGATNAVNLTDGLDGLAIGPVIMAGGAFGVIAYLTGNFRAADYLKILNVRGAGELTVFCGALIGAAVGFLWFNCHPAEMFMGDAGSLALGATIGMLAVLTKAELLLPLIGGLYVVEAVSVIIQVASFKLTGRRIFRMAPLHHHYELSGWAEPKIVVRFWIVSFALALLALTTLKLR